MNLHKFHIPLALVALVSLSLVALLAAAVSKDTPDQVGAVEQPAPKVQESARSRFGLPKVFDFEQYKRLFKKTYRSLAEELVRRKLMLARALRAWISAIKYKYRKSSYYLAVNHMSDWTPDELDRTENKKMSGDHDHDDHVAQFAASGEPPQQQPSAAGGGGDLPVEVDPSHIEEDLAQLMKEDKFVRLVDGNDDNNNYESQSRLRKRDTVASRRAVARNFSMERLVSTGQQVKLEPEVAKKIQLNPASNNPDYEAPELASFGIRDDKWESPRLTRLLPLDDDGGDGAGSIHASKLSKTVSPWWSSWNLDDGDGEGGDGRGPAADLPDEVYFDHRDSRCLLLPRDQLRCGSCHAFAAIAIAEWLYCMRTGNLVAFSEQYLVDCGWAVGNSGCDGGDDKSAVSFIHNYGLELRGSYPYAGAENECPYDADTDPKHMGYIRMAMSSYTRVPVSRFGQIVEFAPIFVGIQTRKLPGFMEYGGGVARAQGCTGAGTHAVLLVGHGREDGLDYWLLRNSHSAAWGEGGYMKLDKATGAACFHKGQGTVFATSNGRSFNVRPAVNRAKKPVDYGQARPRQQAVLPKGFRSRADST